MTRASLASPTLTAAIAGLLAALVLAGCSEDTAADAGGATGQDDVENTNFDDVDVEASAGNGVILGVVVDDRVFVVPGATVTLLDPLRNTTSDELGRFAFSDVPPGTRFLKASHPTHIETQSSVDVVAGVLDPEFVRLQIPRMFTEDPFMVSVTRDGFFECSQAGASPFYSSSNCSDGIFGGTLTGLVPELSNVTKQEREWHSDVPAGWQSIVFEMQWEPTSQTTSERLGMVVSTYKPTRDGRHCFAEGISGTPMRFQVDVGKEGPGVCSVSPLTIPEEGMKDMSYFVSVRPPEGAVCPYTCAPPGIAYQQSFQVYVNMFVYGPAPEGWSFIEGDEDPFL